MKYFHNKVIHNRQNKKENVTRMPIYDKRNYLQFIRFYKEQK